MTVDFITGVNLGFEFLDDEEEGESYLAVDLLIVRLLFFWGKK